MAECVVYDKKGKKVSQIIFRSSPPDAEATVYSGSGQKIGSIKSRHASNEGTVYDTRGTLVGSVFGTPVDDSMPSLAMNPAKDTVGGVVNSHQIMKGANPNQWTIIGTVQTEGWTEADEQGLREAAIASGRGDPGSRSTSLIKVVQIKQRVLGDWQTSQR